MNFENINDESNLNLSLNNVQRKIDLGKELELHFIEKDLSIVQRGKFK